MEFKFEIMTDGGARLTKAEGADKVVSVPDAVSYTHLENIWSVRLTAPYPAER